MSDNFGCVIHTRIARPDKALVERFRNIPVANIDDCMGRIGAVSAEIRPMNKAPLLGTAFTVKVPAGDNLMFHKAMDIAEPGDVVVIDAGGYLDRAIFGELMSNWCRARGIAGVVVDGAIRDCGAISEMTDFSVFARGVSPNGPYKNGPGTINEPISFGGRMVNPGDIIVGDEDGIVVIRPENAADLADAAEKIEAKERKITETMEKEKSYDRPWVDEKLKEIGCVID